ncbi:MAG: heme lyase CcmF/NrfE family subunit [Desulfovibrionaceae bacterium]
MYLLSFAFLILSFLLAYVAIIRLGKSLWLREGVYTVEFAESIFKIISIFSGIGALVLLQALVTSDFTLIYVAGYTDRLLPLFYKITGFWAGQAGSLFFWFLIIVLLNVIFVSTSRYKNLQAETKAWFWTMYFFFIAFFLFLLGTWNNPFAMQIPPPADGAGLNPLLQNIAMIIHPPLLFTGYSGFAVPAALAFAFLLTTEKESVSWVQLVRPFVLIAWMVLGAGILLGSWWAYMELGWGGYWAWDPVENASFIPWLIASAYIHTSLVEMTKNKLHRSNFFLVVLAFLSTIFGTYLVRGGVIQSIHAFAGGVGTPLILFVLIGIALSAFLAITTPRKATTLALDGVNTKEGLLVLMSWLLLAISIIIIIATLWPVITKGITGNSMGLGESFYNRVILPLFMLIVLLMLACSVIQWKSGIQSKKEPLILLGIVSIVALVTYFIGYNNVLASIAVGLSVAAIYASRHGLFFTSAKLSRRFVASQLSHLGFAFIVLGVAFSGPFKEVKDLELNIGEQGTLGKYTFTYEKFLSEGGVTQAFFRVFLQVEKDGKPFGTLYPEKRVYQKYEKMSFTEASTMPSLYEELYSSLLSVSQDNSVLIRVSIEPFVNWIWIGSFFLCLGPLVGFLPTRKKKEIGV